MKYYVISPNADGQGSEKFLPEIFNRHVALMGWGKDEHELGRMFANIQKGDRIIIAQGANRNKTVYAIGIADSNSCKGEIVNQEIHLAQFIKDKQLLKSIRFNPKCTWGDANRIRAIYSLKDNVEADRIIMNAIENLISKNIMKEQLKAMGNIILHGAPGTGKTYKAKQIAKQLNAKTQFVQFHPSYDYTDFVEGLRPIKQEGNQIGFERKDGVFKAFCKEAIKKNNDQYVFIIDEINRGDMSKIFGELFFSIDPGYRGEDGKVDTQYQNLIEDGDVFKDGFYVPKNVYIIGTMNDIDRSVESMDFAMRRRFAFVEITAKESQSMLTLEAFRKVNDVNADKAYAEVDELKERMNTLNDEIISPQIGLSTDYQIGAAYFLKFALYADQEKTQAYKSLWDNHLKSVITEYLRGTGDESSKFEKLKAAYGYDKT